VEEAPLREDEVPVPRPGPGELLLRVRACGACHTDLHTVEGELRAPRYPVTPGHQVVGEVVEAAGSFRAGDRVGVAWLHRACGACAECARGDENLCAKAEFTGLQRDGGYAEFIVAPAEFAYALPAALDDAHAAPLLCAGVVGWRALKLCGARAGGRLGLFGFGASAHVVLQLARARGCESHVFTRGEHHRALALRLGAASAGAADAPLDATPSLDAAILFAPAGALIPLALMRLRPGAALAVASIHIDRVPEIPYELLYRERVLRSVANATRRDAEELLAESVRAGVRTEVETFPLREANAVLARMKEGRLRAAAVLIPTAGTVPQVN
jgi:propanol-preferring alcohol dehydrogenase